MKTSAFIILLIVQMLMGVLHACDVTIPTSNTTTISNFKISSNEILLDYLAGSNDCLTNKNEKGSGSAEACSVHCCGCKLFLELTYFQVAFKLVPLIDNHFYYLSTNYTSFLRIDLQPPINSI